MQLQFSKFRKEDFSEYQSWYADSELNLHLGPMEKDDEWLHAVMQEADGCHYSVFQGNDLVAVIGVILPDSEHPAYFITDFAVKPTHRGKGIGSDALDELIKLHPLKPEQMWKTFVDVRNPKAKTFFEKNGWACCPITPNQDGMIELTFRDIGSQKDS
ncbi:MAG: N-acetyltransferase [Candidatus Peribacteria bacterium]|nr:N-acetyltransferase [Candidatus Peribacteria bacterium]